MSEKVCPMTDDGLHRRMIWRDAKAGRSGFSCVKCHKTWEWHEKELLPTWLDTDE